MKIKRQIFLVFITACFLASCGFTLRGTANIPPELQNMMLVSTENNGDVLRDLRRALAANNVEILDTARPESYRLVLGEVEVVERILSVNSNARAGEYELSMSVPIQLGSPERILIEPEAVNIQKVYLADPDSAVAKAEERELMENEMRRELVVQILRLLQNVTF